ncbi:MAG: LysM peptidoglycan-binding domain-containing protein [Victivallales bacterium]|nr:LysM peptidoglycan-binding domain-containing protein [Victivallales bacterium]
MRRRTLIALLVVAGTGLGFLSPLRAQDVTTEISRMKLNIQESERLNQEQIARVSGSMTMINDNMTAVVTQMNAITGKIQELENRVKLLEAELALAKKQIREESAARQTSMKNFATQVSREITATPSPRPGPAVTPPPSAPAGEFFEYTVQKGATLSAIAKASDVAVEDICRANNIRNDAIIRVGQKLLIPKK